MSGPAAGGGKRGWALTALLFLLLVALKDSQNILHAEFYAEDGWIWYPQAYAQGLASLLHPAGGYLNSVQRLVAISALAFPLHWAPSVFNGFAALVPVGVALFLVSGRMSGAWPDGRARFLFALLFLAMPADHETFGILTNVHWYLALFSFLILFSRPALGFGGRAFDAGILILSGLSGPFCIFLLPVVLWQWSVERDLANFGRGSIVVLTACIQACCLLFVGAGRSMGPLGASPLFLAKIIALIPLDAELGTRMAGTLPGNAFWNANVIPPAIALCTIAVLAAGFAKGGRLLRHFLLFTVLMFAAALCQPLVDQTLEQWPLIANRPAAGGRYFLFPMIAWWGVLFCLGAQKDHALRVPAVLLLLVTLLFAVPLDWPRWHVDGSADFTARAARFEQAPKGTTIEFSIKPYGVAPMVLTKK